MSYPKFSTILALGAESSGGLALLHRQKLYCQYDFGDLQNHDNFSHYQKTLHSLLKKTGARPRIVVCDLHPDYVTTVLAKKLAARWQARLAPVQHHHAHLGTALADWVWIRGHKMPLRWAGIAMDGTGYGLDGTIWGGEVFHGTPWNITRVGSLEPIPLIGGEKAIHEPARILIAAGLPDKILRKFYSLKQLALLRAQLESRFNTPLASSTARVLDAAAVLLGFSPNHRFFKHSAVAALEKHSTHPYSLQPKIQNNLLSIRFLFEYLLKNLKRDRQRLADTAQTYIARGLFEIARRNVKNAPVFFGGGMADNGVMRHHLEPKGAICAQKLPRGDAGIAIGQMFRVLSNS